MTDAGYSSTELMVCASARLMRRRTTVFIGTGLPMLAAALAKKLYAPELLPVFEFGGIGSTLDELPLGVGESRTFDRAFAALGICDVMETAQRGLIHDGFLGGAQIDPHGNLNTTVIGSHQTPKVRLPGSGGANEVGSFCQRTVIIMKQDRRRFVQKLDFLTTPGFLTGPGARERAGLPGGTGPYRVVTDMAVYDFDPASLRMRLISLHPGVKLDSVREATGFPLKVRRPLAVTPPPTPLELSTLREKVDPGRLFLGA